MPRQRLLCFAIAASLAAGCTTGGRGRSVDAQANARASAAVQSASNPHTPPAPASSRASTPANTDSLQFVADDLDAAKKRALAERKALFVDAWAPWCHTCLSMQNYVLNQPALAPLAERVVFAAIDTDKPENAVFLERHDVAAWPTFFMLDPADERVIGYWPGAASLTEMRRFIDDSLASLDALKDGTIERDPALGLLLKAKAAQAKADHARAAELFQRAIDKAPADWRRRNEALSGLITALFHRGRAEPCVTTGLRYIDQISGAALPTDATHLVFECTQGLPPARRAEPRRKLIAKLRDLAEHPAPDAAPDDHADTYAQLASALSVTGDRNGAHDAQLERLTILEAAAKRAPTPQAAATYDYGRALAYVGLGRAEEAVAMLEQREKELPDSYEPPARLASVLTELKRFADAEAAVDRALSRAYGPRRLRYLALKARIQTERGDRNGAIATLEREVAGHRELGRGEQDEGLRDALKRLGQARAR